MANLGIFVTSANNMAHVMGVVKAAKAKGNDVKGFLYLERNSACKGSPVPRAVQYC